MCLSVFFFKQKTAYEMRISDWSSDVCSSDLELAGLDGGADAVEHERRASRAGAVAGGSGGLEARHYRGGGVREADAVELDATGRIHQVDRSEEHTSELQSLMRISYAVFCLKKKTFN